MTKVIKYIKIICLMILSYIIVTCLLIMKDYSHYPSQNTEIMLILGGSLVRATQVDRYASPWLQSKIDVATSYLQAHPNIRKVICTGKGFESDIICNNIQGKNIRDIIFYKDRASSNTYENFIEAKKLYNLQEAILVTNDFHMYRSMMLANRLGIKVYPLTAKFQGNIAQFMYYHIREMFAIGKSFLFDR